MLGRDVISTTVAMLTGHCVMGRHAERMRLPFNDIHRGFRFAEEDETVIYFFFHVLGLHQCSSVLLYLFRLICVSPLLHIPSFLRPFLSFFYILYYACFHVLASVYSRIRQ